MLEARQRHFDELPFDVANQALERRARPMARAGEGAGGIRRVMILEPQDQREDLGLPAAVLPEHDVRLGTECPRLRPVQLEHLLSQLAGGDGLRRLARQRGSLHADIHQPEEHRILVGRRGARLIEQTDQPLGEDEDCLAVVTHASKQPFSAGPSARRRADRR
ncbi:MAG: hypothetical protein ACREFI_11270, partial [Stellaceae bacterium]